MRSLMAAEILKPVLGKQQLLMGEVHLDVRQQPLKRDLKRCRILLQSERRIKRHIGEVDQFAVLGVDLRMAGFVGLSPDQPNDGRFPGRNP